MLHQCWNATAFVVELLQPQTSSYTGCCISNIEKSCFQMWNLNTRILQSPIGKLGNITEKDSMRVLKQLSILLVWTKPCWDFYVPQLFNLSTAGALWKQLCGDDASWVLTFMLTFTPTLCFELWNLSWLSALDIMDTWRHNHVEETTCCTSLVSFMSLCQHTKITETFRRWRSRSVEFRWAEGNGAFLLKTTYWVGGGRPEGGCLLVVVWVASEDRFY